MSRILFTIALATLLSACSGDDGRESGPITSDPGSDQGSSSNSDNGADMSSSDDDGGASTPDGGGPDGGTLDEDMGGTGTEPPTGEVCGYDDLRQFAGNCDPVRVQGCAAPEQCLPGIQVAGAQTNQSAFCRESDIHLLEEGSVCGENPNDQCRAGLICISFYSECRRLCYPDTALGCEPGEFCRRPSRSWEGIGFCDSTCNL